MLPCSPSLCLGLLCSTVSATQSSRVIQFVSLWGFLQKELTQSPDHRIQAVISYSWWSRSACELDDWHRQLQKMPSIPEEICKPGWFSFWWYLLGRGCYLLVVLPLTIRQKSFTPPVPRDSLSSEMLAKASKYRFTALLKHIPSAKSPLWCIQTCCLSWKENYTEILR